MEIGCRHRQAIRDHLHVGGGGRRPVRGNRVIPHSELNEHVRGHMPGMARFRNGGRVGTGRVERLLRVVRIVPGVNQIVERGGMSGVLLENPGKDLRRQLLLPAAGKLRQFLMRSMRGACQAASACGHQCETVEGARVGIGWMARRKLSHRRRESREPRGAIPLTEERVQRPEPLTIALRSRRKRPAPPHPGEDRPCFFDVLVSPQQLLVAHRLAPVRHRVPRIGGLSALESRERALVLEAVHPRDTGRDLGTRVGAACRHRTGEHRHDDR